MENYVVLEHIGEGSFGKVYKARRKNTGFTVAMKFITKTNKNMKDLKSLRQEIGILKKLNHENIILMYDAFETEREFCVVTEYAPGELFAILQDDQTLPEATIQTIAKQLVKALHYLHSNRIIHRDMKPQNVLLATDGTVKLCDFGFARSMSSNTLVLTSIKGTPLYMSPELVKELPYDNTSDLWSLGVILFELYVGQPPFYTNNIYSLINLIVQEPVKYPPSMSKEFKSFLQGLLHKNPAKRLNWPHLSLHPFVRENKEAEPTLQKGFSPMGGHRERIERIMETDAAGLLRTQQLDQSSISPESLPHHVAKMERMKVEASIREQARKVAQEKFSTPSKKTKASEIKTPVSETKRDTLSESKLLNLPVSSPTKQLKNTPNSATRLESKIQEISEEDDLFAQSKLETTRTEEKKANKSPQKAVPSINTFNNNVNKKPNESYSTVNSTTNNYSMESFVGSEDISSSHLIQTDLKSLQHLHDNKSPNESIIEEDEGIGEEIINEDLAKFHEIVDDQNEQSFSYANDFVNEFTMDSMEVSHVAENSFVMTESQLFWVRQYDLFQKSGINLMLEELKRNPMRDSSFDGILRETHDLIDTNQSVMKLNVDLSCLSKCLQLICLLLQGRIKSIHNDTSPDIVPFEVSIPELNMLRDIMTYLFQQVLPSQPKNVASIIYTLVIACIVISFQAILPPHAIPQNSRPSTANRRNYFSSISTSDQWCLVACLSSFLSTKYIALDPAYLLLQQATLRAMGAIISTSSPVVFGMLFAQQLPSIFTHCLIFNKENIPPTNLTFPSDYLFQTDQCGLIRMTLSLSLVQKFVHSSNSSYCDRIYHDLLSNVPSDVGSFEISRSVHCLHTLALLTHTVGEAWSSLAFPLEVMINQEIISKGEDLSYYSEVGGDRISLRNQIIQSIQEKLCDVDESFLSCFVILVRYFCESNELTGDIIFLRSAALRILSQLTYGINSSGFLSRLSNYSSLLVGGLVALFVKQNKEMIASLQPINEANAPTSSSCHHDIFSHGLTVLILYNCIEKFEMKGDVGNVLTSKFSELLALLEVVLSESDDIRLLSASISLCCTIHSKLGLLPTSTATTLRTQLLKVAISDITIKACLAMLNFFIQSKLDGTYRSDQSLWLRGTEFGMRSSGLVDSVFMLLSEVLEPLINVDYFIGLIVNEAIGNPSQPMPAKVKEFLSSTSATEMAILSCKLIQVSGCGELSPLGSASLCKYLSLYLTHIMSSMDQEPAAGFLATNKTAAQMILEFTLSQGLLGVVSLMFHPKHLHLIESWSHVTHPYRQGKEIEVESSLIADIFGSAVNICRLLLLALDALTDHNNNTTQDNDVSRLNNLNADISLDKLIQTFYDSVYRASLIKYILEVLKIYGIIFDTTLIMNAVHFIMDLTLTSTKYLAQFVENSGLFILDTLNCFGKPLPLADAQVKAGGPLSREDLVSNEIISYSLQIAAQMARNSEKYFNQLFSVLLPVKLGRLLYMEDANIRAKTCNLIGNLCRHSAGYYGSLTQTIDLGNQLTSTKPPSQHQSKCLLELLIHLCSDSSSNVRKFACFAVGNAAFHNSSLYPQLVRAVPHLMEATRDNDDKARANAAGALGNLLRNTSPSPPETTEDKGSSSGIVAMQQVICARKCPELLLSIAFHDPSLFVKRIAIFSIGTFAAYAGCRL